MNFAPGYLIQRFFYRIFEFLRHWYLKSGKIYSNFVIDKLEDIDYYLAWRVTLKNLFQPLYKDYSIIGYVLGFFFRFWRLLIGTVIYAFIFIIAIGLYIIWFLIPPYLLAHFFGLIKF